MAFFILRSLAFLVFGLAAAATGWALATHGSTWHRQPPRASSNQQWGFPILFKHQCVYSLCVAGLFVGAARVASPSFLFPVFFPFLTMLRLLPTTSRPILPFLLLSLYPSQQPLRMEPKLPPPLICSWPLCPASWLRVAPGSCQTLKLPRFCRTPGLPDSSVLYAHHQTSWQRSAIRGFQNCSPAKYTGQGAPVCSPW